MHDPALLDMTACSVWQKSLMSNLLVLPRVALKLASAVREFAYAVAFAICSTSRASTLRYRFVRLVVELVSLWNFQRTMNEFESITNPKTANITNHAHLQHTRHAQNSECVTNSLLLSPSMTVLF